MIFQMMIGGDADGGWLVDVHDGAVNTCYSPAVPTVMDAAMAALKMHADAIGHTFTDPAPPADETGTKSSRSKKSASSDTDV